MEVGDVVWFKGSVRRGVVTQIDLVAVVFEREEGFDMAILPEEVLRLYITKEPLPDEEYVTGVDAPTDEKWSKTIVTKTPLT